MFKLDLEKAEEPEIKLVDPLVHRKSKKIQKKKTCIFASMTRRKPLTVWITTKCGKLKRWEYQTTLPAS